MKRAMASTATSAAPARDRSRGLRGEGRTGERDRVLVQSAADPIGLRLTQPVGREMVWRMSPYERGRRGNTLPSGLRGRSVEGNALAGRRGSGHSVATDAEAQPDAELDLLRPVLRGEGATRTPRSWGEGCASTAASHRAGRPALTNGVQSRGQNRTREIRPSGIVGGLQETWPMVKLGTHAATERAAVVTPHLSVRAPGLYPDIRTSGLTSGVWKRSTGGRVRHRQPKGPETDRPSPISPSQNPISIAPLRR